MTSEETTGADVSFSWGDEPLVSSFTSLSRKKFQTSLMGLICNNDSPELADINILTRPIISIIVEYARSPTMIIGHGYSNCEGIITINVSPPSSSPSLSTSSPMIRTLSSPMATVSTVSVGKWTGGRSQNIEVKQSYNYGYGAIGVINNVAGDDKLYWCSTVAQDRYMACYSIDTGDMIDSTTPVTSAAAAAGAAGAGRLSLWNDYHHRGVHGVYHDQLFLACGDSNKSFELYNPERNEWSYGPSLTYEHTDGAAITLNGRIYAIGGVNGCEAYDDRSDATWQGLKPMLQLRYGFALVGVSDYQFIAIGGSSRDDTTYYQCLTILEYDSRNDQWMESTRYPLLSAANRFYGSAALMDNTIIALPASYTPPQPGLDDATSMPPFGYYLPLPSLSSASSTHDLSSQSWLPIPNGPKPVTWQRAIGMIATVIH